MNSDRLPPIIEGDQLRSRNVEFDVRIAIVYDNTIRKDTTGEYCRRALDRLCARVDHFLPTQMFSIPGDYDLYLNIDDGQKYRLPAYLRPSVYWAIDTHLQYDWHLEKSHGFDQVFVAQRDGAEQLRRDGIEDAHWLPLACEPDLHRPIAGLPKVYDIGFVGNVPFEGDPRSAFLRLIRERFPRHFIGNAYFDDMARVYSQSKIVFNISVRNDVNMRVFEGIACGSLLLTNDLGENGQNELFTPGKHYMTYRTQQEFIELAERYLADDEGRERIARAGQEHAYRRHTYWHRMRELLEVVAPQGRVALQPKERDVVAENRDLAEQLVRAKRWDEAAKKLVLVLRLRPDHAEVWNDMGAIHFMSGRLPEARDCFARAVDLKPSYVLARENLEAVSGVMGVGDGAISKMQSPSL